MWMNFRVRLSMGMTGFGELEDGFNDGDEDSSEDFT